ncbi:MAG TPA: hypothetical protein VLJ80_04575 [Solirubrobacteraceae bacterium]|nr:hypothetical protein [Solirubrobacteraceae bacterium]
MSRSEQRPPRRTPPRYGGYVGLLALLIIALITINTIVTKPNGVKGLAPGERAPPFAVPLALGNLNGDADTATRPNEGAAGRVPACQERGSQILNICELYEGAPVVLALFVDGGSCPDVLDEMQALAPSFPGVRFAGVALKGDRGRLRKLIRTHRLSLPIGIDSDGALAALYKVGTCPQVSFLFPGGEVQGGALINTPSRALLRRRLATLVSGARGRGWRGPAR